MGTALSYSCAKTGHWSRNIAAEITQAHSNNLVVKKKIKEYIFQVFTGAQVWF